MADPIFVQYKYITLRFDPEESIPDPRRAIVEKYLKACAKQTHDEWEARTRNLMIYGTTHPELNDGSE